MNFEPIKQYFQKPKFIILDENINGKDKTKDKTKKEVKEKVKEKVQEDVQEEVKEKTKKVIDFNKLSSYEVAKYMYNNTRGINTPDSYMLVLDSKVIGSTERANNFVYNKVVFDLCDPIIIDSPTDIYLEFIHFQHTDISDSSGTEITPHLELTSQFYLDIDEFSIRNISNNQFQSGKFLIPNEVYGKTDQNQNDNDTNVRSSYIRLKSNYLCRIEANYLTKLTLSIRGEGANGAAGSDDTTFGYLSNTENASFTAITNQAELIAWAADLNAIGQLQNDIELVGGTWPLELGDNKILDGNGYTITIHNGMTGGMFVLNNSGYTATIKYLIIDADNIGQMNSHQGVLFSTGADPGADNLTINITHVGIIGTFQYGTGGGGVFGKFDENTGCNVTITNCFSEGETANGAGGLVGAFTCNGNGSVKIHNCFTTGTISVSGGGIAGNEFGKDHESNGDAIITNCYSTGNITGQNGGGIIGGNGGGSNSITSRILIGNCYSFGDITNSTNGGGGIVGFNSYLSKIKMEHCHSVHATGDGPGHEKLIDNSSRSGTAEMSNNSSGSGAAWSSSNPTLGSSLLDNYTDSYGVLTDTNVWITTGNFANGYGLSVFSKSPWNSYTSNTSLPTLTKGCNSYSDRTGAVKIGLYFNKKSKRKGKNNSK